MFEPAPVDTIVHAIQLAVTPVFLLSGVGAILVVLANRLARIVDRGRELHERLQRDAEEPLPVERELRNIARRMRVVNGAIVLCTLRALAICTVVALLFLGAIDGAGTIALLFIGAMGSLIAALLAFLVEIYLATDRSPLRR